MTVGLKSALQFLDKVKKVYGAESPQYQGFIDVLKDFKAGRADARETTEGVIALFQGHPELIEGYSTFLPPGAATQPPGTTEIAQDAGTMVDKSHTQAPKRQDVEAELPELTEWDKRLLENLRVRVADSEEHAKYEVFMTSFEAYLKTATEQRKASLDADQGHEFVEKLKELLGDGGFKEVSSTALNSRADRQPAAKL